ncbi:MAG: hypothetical protein JWN62_2893, partial [Acidimicrobiales bacterium]|nr:hypothetical protein [Acidimicrobiales bacterium]
MTTTPQPAPDASGSRPYDTVILDLVGTLSESAPGIDASLHHAYDLLGHPKPADFVPFIGPPFELA